MSLPPQWTPTWHGLCRGKVVDLLAPEQRYFVVDLDEDSTGQTPCNATRTIAPPS